MGLAVMTELPLVVIDVQRAGPSTGMPTKNEQSDLLQIMFGRNGDSPLPVVAPATPGRVLRPRHRGLPDRAQVHDPGRVHVRRVPGDRLGAVADPVDRRPSGHQRPECHGQGDLPAVPARQHDARPAVGGARDARSGAPDRRPREGRCDRQRRATTRTTTTTCRSCGRPRSRASPTTSGRSRSSGPIAATCSSSAGARPTAPSARPSRAFTQTGGPSLTLTCVISTRSRRTPRPCFEAYRRVLIPEVNLGQLRHAHPGEVPHRRGRLRPCPGQALPNRRDHRGGSPRPRGVMT